MNPLIIKPFGQYLKEETGQVSPTQLVSYTFMDGTIPISENEVVSFTEFDQYQFGPHVSMEGSGQGPVLYIDTPYSDGGEIYVVRFTSEFMNDLIEFGRYLILLRNPA